jgi:NADH dehydrogenase FAD-containing subunit
MKRWNEVFKRADTDNSGTIDLAEFTTLVGHLTRRYPAMSEILARARPLFEEFDTDNSGTLSEDEFQRLLKVIESNLTRFPSTATVAVQQGRFLAKTLNKAEEDGEEDKPAEPEEEEVVYPPFEEREKDYKTPLISYAYRQLFSEKEPEPAAEEPKEDSKADTKDDKEEPKEDGEEEAQEDPNKPVFRYKHIGGFEYVGAEDGFVERGSAGQAIVTGPGAMWMWRSVYFSKSLSLTMHTRMWYDWFYYRVFGRSATRL